MPSMVQCKLKGAICAKEVDATGSFPTSREFLGIDKVRLRLLTILVSPPGSCAGRQTWNRRFPLSSYKTAATRVAVKAFTTLLGIRLPAVSRGRASGGERYVRKHSKDVEGSSSTRLGGCALWLPRFTSKRCQW